MKKSLLVLIGGAAIAAVGLAPTGAQATTGIGSLAGVVTDSAGSPLTNVSVSITANAAPHAAVTIVTGAKGTFADNALAPGSYSVCFTADRGTFHSGISTTGYTYQCWKNQPVGSTPTPVVIAAGKGTQINQVLQANGGVSGTVTDDAGVAVPGATVTVTQSTGSQHVKTAADGSYAFTGVPVGLTSVCVTGPAKGGGAYGWAVRCWKNNPNPASPTQFQVRAATTSTGISVSLLRNGAVSGVVVDDALQPIAGATVTLASLNGLAPATATGSSYSFNAVAPGFYTVCASAPGYTTACFNNTTPAAPTTLLVPSGTLRAGVGIQLGAAA